MTGEGVVRGAVRVEGVPNDQARKRLAEIKRSVGGIAGEHPRRIPRLRDAVEVVEAEAVKISGDFTEVHELEREARILAQRFGLEMPELRSLTAPGRDDEIGDLTRRVRDLSFPDRPPFLSQRRQGTIPGHLPGAEIIRQAGEQDEPAQAQTDRERRRKEREERQREAARGVSIPGPSRSAFGFRSVGEEERLHVTRIGPVAPGRPRVPPVAEREILPPDGAGDVAPQIRS